MKSHWLFVVLFFQTTMLIAQTTTYRYALKVAGINVGMLEATQQIKADRVEYTAESNASISFFGKHTFRTSLKAIYQNGVLVSSKNTAWRDGEIDFEVETKKIATGYIVIEDGKEYHIKQPITYSSICLYFDQPNNIIEVFFEPDAIFRKIKSVGANNFRLMEEGKATNRYQYDTNGLLQNAVFESGFFDVSIILRQ